MWRGSKSNREAYKSGHYNETQVRREFVDPLFKALGWDIDNEQGFAEAYKDVIHEDAIKVGGTTRAPDYSFRIGGQRKFFLETKKPSVDIKEDIHPAFQLRRYAWDGKAAPVHPHRLRGVLGLRRHHQAGQEGICPPKGGYSI